MSTGTSGRADTRFRIVDVAARLLQQEGPAAVTTRQVAQQAGVQAPTIYRLFGDKDGLLEAVAEHVMATYAASKAETVQAAAATDVDPLDDLRAGWELQIEFGLANPTLFHLLSDPARALHSPAIRSGREVLATRVHRIAVTGRLRVSEKRAIELIQAAGIGTVQTLLSILPQQRDPGLAPEMFQAVLRQILTETAPRTADDPIAAAVAFRAVAPGLGMLSDAERQLLADWLDRAIDAR